MNDNMFRLDGEVALVTGSSRGLGAAMAMALAEAGADVVLHDRCCAGDTERTIKEKTGVRTLCVVADLMDRAETIRLVDGAVDAMGKVDILVNNAGIIGRAPAVGHEDLDWDEVLEINLTAVFRLCRAAGGRMVARGHGKIINVASLLAFQGGILVPSYAAAKGGVAQLTKALANEWADREHQTPAGRSGALRADHRAHPGRPLGRPDRPGRAGGVPRVEGVGLPERTCAGGRWRVDGTVKHRAIV
jgi:2-deoxy-D-gluconate 3-dehydrogenase